MLPRQMPIIRLHRYEQLGMFRKLRTVHLGRHDRAGEDTATDGDHAGERALLVDVGALDGVLGRAEAQTDIFIPSPVASVLARSADLVVEEDVRLSRCVSLVAVTVVVGGRVVPASGRRAPTGHCSQSVCNHTGA
jgi:hypothetical protein